MSRAFVRREGFFRWFAVVTIYKIDFTVKPPRLTDEWELRAIEGPFWSKKRATAVANSLGAHQALYEARLGVVS